MQGLEREVGEHEAYMQSANGILLSLKWELQDTEEALDAAGQTLKTTHKELSALQQKRIEGIESYFRERVQALRDFFLNNIQEITESHTAFKNELETLIQLVSSSVYYVGFRV